MTGRVCEKHQEYCHDGNCRWCEPEPLRVCDDGTVLYKQFGFTQSRIADNISNNNLLLKHLREKARK